ncbi:hypothetical protein DICPUDRAFT_159703 [Dictyostelium purpureum]|uniref:non-specific serine/threonine protein kinase n=1 Tax=Dictyostelium purpureum TaxID=5786 RepID=F1A4S5_DICPU|nr:uncharacterized protein DICPUDRAFT_159703 [Dictyostelium purpureum]EGC28807.1 hypothetical protein DICPUDRAFT_159703 [Dictyostelium purpureum]|eukprot:XP_003294669.1 hypothetical protein DICPUDRAFT_159703 [Dictyostelium purpureum]
MNIGMKVREIGTGQIGVVEKGNNSNGYYVNFGSRKNWKKGNELEIIHNTIASGASNSASGAPARSNIQPIQQQQQQQAIPLKQPPKPTVQSEDPGPRFGNFKLPAKSSSPKYSTLPSRAFFEAASASNDIGKKPAMNGSRPGIPNFEPPTVNNTQNDQISSTQLKPTSVQQPPPIVPKRQPNVQQQPPPLQQTTQQPQQPPPLQQKQPPQQPSIQTPPPLVQKPQPLQKPTNINIPPQPIQNNKVQPSPRNEFNETWNIDFGELLFENEIGSGKYGVVSVGKWLGTPVAIKRLLENNDETNGLVEREIQILKEIRHPQIVQFLGVSRNTDNEIHIITEFMDGGDLFDALIFGDVPLSWKEKLRIALDLAQSCRYLQARGILHRDLKSQNVLLNSSKRAKLCDLGLARVFDDRINKRLTCVGSDRWMAPEISMGENYDYKIDVFSYGIVLVEIITEKIPDERYPQRAFAFDAQAFLKKVPADCPQEFAKLTVECTKTNPKDRPSFLKILEIVEELYESLPEDEE